MQRKKKVGRWTRERLIRLGVPAVLAKKGLAGTERYKERGELKYERRIDKGR